MSRLEPSLPLSVGFGAISCPPPEAWHRGAIDAGPVPIDLVMFTQADQHGLVQLPPDTSGIPAAQASPASHAAAVPKGLEKVFQWNACLQHKQEAVEGGFMADCELARTALGKAQRLGLGIAAATVRCLRVVVP